MSIDIDKIVAIDMHTHAEVGRTGEDGLPPEWRAAADKYFGEDSDTDRRGRRRVLPRAQHGGGRLHRRCRDADRPRRGPERGDRRGRAANADVLIPFGCSTRTATDAVDEVRRLVRDYGVRGFKFHPNIQAFVPNDEAFYPIYEAIAEASVPALFHTGHSGIGTGLPGGGGIRLKYSNPMYSTTSRSTSRA